MIEWEVRSIVLNPVASIDRICMTERAWAFCVIRSMMEALSFCMRIWQRRGILTPYVVMAVSISVLVSVDLCI